MKIAVCTIIGDYVDYYAKYTSVNMRCYCNRYGYDFVCQEGSIDKSRYPTWSKVKLVENLLNEIEGGGNKYDWVMWIDSDAVITNKNIKIEEIIGSYGDLDFIVAKEDCCELTINAGVFLVKNTEWSKNFLKKWYAQTQYLNTGWLDNSALIYLQQYDNSSREKIKLVKQRIFNSFVGAPGREGSEGIWKEGDFICHYAGVPNRTPLKWLGYYGDPNWVENRNQLSLLLNKLGLEGIGAEIGVEKGLYSEVLLGYSKLKKLYLIDPWKHFEGYNDPCNVNDGLQQQKFEETQKRLSKFIGRFEIVRMVSNDAVKLFADNSLDFVYIDANHSYKNVLSDINAWFPKVKKGGIIGGHDFMDDNTTTGVYGVRRAVNEYFKNWKGEIYITPEEYPTWYLVK